MAHCTSCGFELGPEWRNCGNCGSPVNQMQVNEEIVGNSNLVTSPSSVQPASEDPNFQICSNCGHQLYAGWRKCNSCQQPVNTNKMPQIQEQFSSQVMYIDESSLLTKELRSILIKRIFAFIVVVLSAVMIWRIKFYTQIVGGELSGGELSDIAFFNWLKFISTLIVLLIIHSFFIDSRWHSRKKDIAFELEFKKR
jgi:hypothetical protein